MHMCILGDMQRQHPPLCVHLFAWLLKVAARMYAAEGFSACKTMYRFLSRRVVHGYLSVWYVWWPRFGHPCLFWLVLGASANPQHMVVVQPKHHIHA